MSDATVCDQTEFHTSGTPSAAPTRRFLIAGAMAAGALMPGQAWAATKRPGHLSLDRQRALMEQFHNPGPYPVKTANPLSFEVADQKKDLLVKVSYPDPSTPSRGETFPVVLFSHGALSSKDLYDRVTDHWASHGIVTIMPTHLDSESLNYKMGSVDQNALVNSRIGDMKFLLDHLDEIANQSPALAGRIGKDKIAVAGHSFGVMIALAMVGLPLKRPDGQLVYVGDPRIKAMVSYNGVGNLPYVGDDWSSVTVPTFAGSGTNDPGATGDGILRPWRWRMGAYDLTAGTDRYAASITSGDHYYGGLICREGAGGKPDPEGLAIINAMSTAFLAAYTNGDAEAKNFLKQADLPPLTAERGFLERARVQPKTTGPKKRIRR